MPQWFLPAHQRMGGLLTSGEAGEKLAGMVIASGGGQDPWHVAHEGIAFLQRFLGDAASVRATLSSPAATAETVDETGNAVTLLVQLELPWGRQGSITICCQPRLSLWAEERRVFTTEGMLLVRDNPEDEMPLVMFAGSDFRPIRVVNPPQVREWAAREAVMRISDALIAGTPGPVTVQEARQVVAAWEAAQRSAATGEYVTVS